MPATTTSTTATGSDESSPASTSAPRPPSGGRANAHWLAFALALPALLWMTARFSFVCDDAFISFRYARNLARGAGLRFNPGTEPPVEGFTNLLWVLAMGAVEALHLDPARWSQVLSVASAVLLLYLVLRFVHRTLGCGPVGTAAVGLFVATLPATGLWATSGLATMPLALCVFGCFERLLGAERPRGLQAGAYGAVAALLRADGIVWIALILGAALLSAGRDRRARLWREGLFPAGVLSGVAVVAQTGFRVAYFHELVPNTAKAKIGLSGGGLARGASYSITWLLILPSLGVVLIAEAWRRGLPGTIRCVAAGAIFGGLAYAALVGGDFMPFGRFLLPAVPFVALFFAAPWRRAALAGRRSAYAPALLAACLALNLAAARDWNVVPDRVLATFHFRPDRSWMTEISRWREMRRNTARRATCAQALAGVCEPGESIVLGAIGVIGYFTELHVFDLHGLVSPRVLREFEPQPGRSPGHDFEAPIDAFLDERPTYLGAWVAPPGEPNARRLEPFIRDGSGILERHPLRTEDGFPPDLELSLVRNPAADAGVSAPASRDRDRRGS